MMSISIEEKDILGQDIPIIRSFLGLTKSEFADIIGVHVSTITSIECGVMSNDRYFQIKQFLANERKKDGDLNNLLTILNYGTDIKPSDFRNEARSRIKNERYANRFERSNHLIDWMNQELNKKED